MPHSRIKRTIAGALLSLLAAGAAGAQLNPEIERLQRQIDELRRRDVERQHQLEDLQRKLEVRGADPGEAALNPTATSNTQENSPESALDRELAAIETEAPESSTQDTPNTDWVATPLPGGAKLRLVDISVDTLLAAGTSTATDDEIDGNLEAGAHDPQRRGFTLQQAEISLAGAVDPYLTAEAHIIYVPGEVELEEAFMTTTALPYGWQVEAGYFLTEFGQINPLHPHAWDWLDQPVINSRVFGGDGLRSPGTRLAWLTPLPWFSEVHFGVQNANEGETTVSFLGDEAIAGRPAVYDSVHNLGDLLYLLRWENFVELSEETGLKVGASGLHGPNSTGANGETWIYGLDGKLRWRPARNFRGWPFFLWQTEILKRDYKAAASTSDGTDSEPPVTLAGDILRDWGLYTQALYGFHYQWAGGVRFEYADGHGPSVDHRQQDTLRDTRYRLSPLLVWQPSEFARFRLQYNYDYAHHLGARDASSFWIGAEVLYGTHAAHKY